MASRRLRSRYVFMAGKTLDDHRRRKREDSQRLRGIEVVVQPASAERYHEWRRQVVENIVFRRRLHSFAHVKIKRILSGPYVNVGKIDHDRPLLARFHMLDCYD